MKRTSYRPVDESAMSTAAYWQRRDRDLEAELGPLPSVDESALAAQVARQIAAEARAISAADADKAARTALSATPAAKRAQAVATIRNCFEGELAVSGPYAADAKRRAIARHLLAIA